MRSPAPPERLKFSGQLSPSAAVAAADCWFDDSCILDTEHFLKTLSVIQGKGVRPDLIGSVIVHFASKWLHDLSGGDAEASIAGFNTSPQKVASVWIKKKIFIETLVDILPREKETVPCDFLLRLLRVANMVGAGAACCAELEKHASRQLDRASLTEVMIPAFSHDCATLLDTGLVLRLVRGFVGLEDGARSGAALVKVAKVVDCYLAEAALDAHLALPEFVALVEAVPSHARVTDDGLYRAIDTYLKAHPNLSKQERKMLCNLIDSRKLSTEASLHAAQNERLPVRAVVQVLLAEQTKLGKSSIDWSGSLSSARSPGGFGLDLPTRCLSKREYTQQMEIKRLREDVARLQGQCVSMERQIEKLLKKKKKKGSSLFGWNKSGMFFSSVFGGRSRIGELDETTCSTWN